MLNMGLREILLKKEQELETQVQIAEKHIDSPLSGTLHISTIKGKTRYYHSYLDQEGNKQLKYLSAAKEGNKIMELAQHSYNAAFLKTATDQLKAVRRALNSIDEDALANVFALLHSERKKLITPFVPDEDMFVRQWEQDEYQPGYFLDQTPLIHSNRGEKIRLYENNGIFVGEQLILTFESSEQPLDKRELELLIEKYLI
jgi:hypothetical protein